MTIDDRSEWLGIEHYSNAPIFNTKAVVRQTGVPAPTLRAWERRYALISPGRAGNAYRLYSERDIALVSWLKAHVDRGMSISQAVALFRHMNKEHQNQVAQEPTEIHFDVATEKPAALWAYPITSDSSMMRPVKQVALGDGAAILPHSPDNYVDSYDMQSARASLMEAFQKLDEKGAQNIMSAMLSLYPLEQVCLELITPTLWEIGSQWAEAKITISSEHFASNFFRAFLTNIFHVTPDSLQGPLALTCCAPGEPHELPALMLSLFLRRRGMHIIYLGQSMEAKSLVQTVEMLEPALVCVSVTISAHIPALADLGRQIESLPSSRPLFVFGGQAFTRSPLLAQSVPGIYLADDNLNLALQRLLVLLQRQSEDNDEVASIRPL